MSALTPEQITIWRCPECGSLRYIGDADKMHCNHGLIRGNDLIPCEPITYVPSAAVAAERERVLARLAAAGVRSRTERSIALTAKELAELLANPQEPDHE